MWFEVVGNKQERDYSRVREFLSVPGIPFLLTHAGSLSPSVLLHAVWEDTVPETSKLAFLYFHESVTVH